MVYQYETISISVSNSMYVNDHFSYSQFARQICESIASLIRDFICFSSFYFISSYIVWLDFKYLLIKQQFHRLTLNHSSYSGKLLN